MRKTMKRIITNWTWLIIFLFQSSCYSDLLLTSREDFKEYAGMRSFWVMQAKKLDGDTILYTRKNPGILTDSSVIVKIESEKSIPKSQADSTRLNYQKTRLAKFWKDGTLYRIYDIRDSLFIYYGVDTFAVPISDIVELKAIKFKKGSTRVLMIGSISVAHMGLIYLLLLAVLSNMSLFG